MDEPFSLLFREHTGIKSAGVFSTYQDSLSMALNQFDELGMIPENHDTDCHTQIKVELKDGCDGAGNQLRIKDARTGSTQSCASMELFGYVILKLIDVTDPVSHFATCSGPISPMLP